MLKSTRYFHYYSVLRREYSTVNDDDGDDFDLLDLLKHDELQRNELLCHIDQVNSMRISFDK